MDVMLILLTALQIAKWGQNKTIRPSEGVWGTEQPNMSEHLTHTENWWAESGATLWSYSPTSGRAPSRNEHLCPPQFMYKKVRDYDIHKSPKPETARVRFIGRTDIYPVAYSCNGMFHGTEKYQVPKHIPTWMTLKNLYWMKKIPRHWRTHTLWFHSCKTQA